MRSLDRFVAAALSVALVIPAASANAQEKFAQPALAAQPPMPPGSQLSVPPAEQLVLLIRLSLLTLSDAIQSGNYSVLRDRGGPAFRKANTAAGLARIFSTLEAQRPDLAAVAIMVPELTEAQIVGPEQRLHLKGRFAIQPRNINFELIYEPADGQWQLFGLSVGVATAQPPPPAAQAAPAVSKAVPSKSAGKKK